jgi:deoxyribodipyrimidine photo-lyase
MTALGPRVARVGNERRGAPPTEVGIVWFRRDLRLADNPALTQALAAHGSIVALFVWDQALVRPAAVPRLQFLRACLDDLDRSKLVRRMGDPVRVVPHVAAAAGAGAV